VLTIILKEDSMSTETAVAAQEITQARGIVVIDQAYGSIAVWNTELITQRLVDLMIACLDDGGFEADGHGLLSVVFRDDGCPTSEDGDRDLGCFIQTH